MMTKVRFFLSLVWHTCRYPPSRKVAWTMASVWAFALCTPFLSIALNPARGLDLTIWVGWSNLICIFLDSFILTMSVKGLRWRLSQDKNK